MEQEPEEVPVQGLALVEGSLRLPFRCVRSEEMEYSPAQHQLQLLAYPRP
jgi:hypothetical protein